MTSTTGQSSSGKLEDQAANAALYVTRAKTPKDLHPLLDKDGKLSSAGAATSLKYARAQDLPSFPSTGGVALSSAGAAASLANNNPKSVDLWKPGSIPAAEKAAVLAKDYEADPLWQPELSAAGSRAALLAHRGGANVKIWRPSETDEGHSAADQALKKKGLSPTVDRAVPAEASRKALIAATGAMSGNRRRADSAPLGPPVHSSYALSAATSSQRNKGHRPTQPSSGGGDPSVEASRIQNLAKNNVTRQMYGSNPPVALEVEEKNRQDMLKASAVAMAQKMYAIQQSHIEEAKGLRRSDSHYAANKVHGRKMSDTASTISIEQPTSYPQYFGLEEAARKLAQERLAKLHDEHQEYRNYYGQSTPPQSRLSMRGRMRRRASSDGQLDRVDEEQSRKIRSQMSIFTEKLAEVDSKKRQSDRDALLAAAQRNVTASMASMDDKVFQQTGKSSPAQRDIWDQEARERAQADSDIRMKNHGKVNIGGGRYLDQEEVDAIARARLQPTLDEISEKAEKQRAADELARLDEERRKHDAAVEKARDADLKMELKRARDLEKQEQQAKKAEEKRIQREETAALKEKARAEKEEKKKSKEAKPKGLGTIFGITSAGTAAGVATIGPAGAGVDAVAFDSTEPVGPEPVGLEPTHATMTANEIVPNLSTPAPVHHLTTLEKPASTSSRVSADAIDLVAARPVEDQTEQDIVQVKVEEAEAGEKLVVPMAEERDVAAEPALPVKSESGIKSWLKARFRSSSKTTKDNAEIDDEKTGTLGGAALTSATTASSTASPDDEKTREDSMREVAMVGRSATHDTDDLYAEPDISPTRNVTADAGSKSPSISPMSSNDEGEDGKAIRRGRLGFRERVLGKSKREDSSKTSEDEFAEARDTFEEETLAPPPKLTTVVSAGQSTKSASSPARGESRFTEEL